PFGPDAAIAVVVCQWHAEEGKAVPEEVMPESVVERKMMPGEHDVMAREPKRPGCTEMPEATRTGKRGMTEAAHVGSAHVAASHVTASPHMAATAAEAEAASRHRGRTEGATQRYRRSSGQRD